MAALLVGGIAGYFIGGTWSIPAGYGTGRGWGAAVGAIVCAWATNRFIEHGRPEK
jgi:hypothetical protein